MWQSRSDHPGQPRRSGAEYWFEGNVSWLQAERSFLVRASFRSGKRFVAKTASETGTTLLLRINLDSDGADRLSTND
jgi:hypothetical protein